LAGRTRAFVAILVGLAVGAAACSSGDGPLSAREYQRQATLACTRADRETSALRIPALDERGSADAIARLVTIERHTMNELRDLKPPRQLQSRVDEWLATIDQLVVEAEFLGESVRHGDRRVADTVAERAARLSLRSQDLASRIGVRGCTLPTPPPVDPSVE
jgi:hypothetical protein